MYRTLTLVMLCLAWAAVTPAQAGEHGRRQGDSEPWHAMYYGGEWGIPVAVLVPPTTRRQAHESWDVAGTRVTPVRAQFRRLFPGFSTYDRSLYQPTPRWPSDTDQLGYYYIRGPRR